MEKYLYFRTQATASADDAADDSACWPLSSFLGMHPTADDTLVLHFKPQIAAASDVTDGEDFTNNDSVVLTVGTNDHKDAMQALIKALYKDEGFNADGADNFVVVADDLSTNTKYLVSEVTAVGAITIGAAFS